MVSSQFYSTLISTLIHTANEVGYDGEFRSHILQAHVPTSCVQENMLFDFYH